jgi:hypothetical protein
MSLSFAQEQRELSSASLKYVCLMLFFISLVLVLPFNAHAQRSRAQGFGQRAVVVDERLAALRDGPGLAARLLRRLSRGRMVSVLETKRTHDGLTFHRVAVTRRTRGWLQMESIVSAARRGDDSRFFKLIQASKDFDLISRASIFLETFPRSQFRPAVLLLLGDAAEESAQKLSREAVRRLDEDEMKATGAPLFSYFMSYNGLDRYQRQGVGFVFDVKTKQYHYDGECWREIVRRHPQSDEARAARQRLSLLATAQK